VASRRWWPSYKRPTSTGSLTRKVDQLVQQLGLAGMSKSTVSRLCRGLDEQVGALRERPLEGRYLYLWLDAKIERVREPVQFKHVACELDTPTVLRPLASPRMRRAPALSPPAHVWSCRRPPKRNGTDARRLSASSGKLRSLTRSRRLRRAA
jgi:hypothetical protein